MHNASCLNSLAFLLICCGCEATKSSEQPQSESARFFSSATTELAGSLLNGGSVTDLDRDLRAYFIETPWTELASSEYWPVFVRRGNRLALIVGQTEVQDARYLQMLNHHNYPELIPLADFPFKATDSLWVSRNSEITPRATIGQTGITLDKKWANLGLVKPFEEYAAQFQIRNEGQRKLIVARVFGSCGCLNTHLTSPDDSGESPVNVIEPNARCIVQTTLKTPKHPLIMQTVSVQLLEEGSAESKVVEFYVFANQEASMEVRPAKLNFGTLSEGGGPVTRTITLTEVPTDRFAVTDVTSERLKLSYKVETEELRGGLRVHRISVTLSPDSLERGHYDSDEITVHTSSDHVSKLRFPTKLQVKGSYEFAPHVVSFGECATGSQKEVSFFLEGPDLNQATIKVVKQPSNCDVEFTRISDQRIEFVISATFGEPGFVSRKLQVQIDGNGVSETLEIPCVALVVDEH